MNILKPEAVRIAHTASSKKRLFSELAQTVCDVYGLSNENVAKALMERESLGPTGVGGGVALPHARIEGLDGVKGCFLRLEKPMDFEAVDRQPVDLIFALFAPDHASSGAVDHLKALALVSRTLRDKGVCEKLRNNNDPATLFAILTERLASKAA